jgi:hypothetical protein
VGKGVPSANRGWVVTTAGFPQGQRYATLTMPLGGRCSCVVTVSSSAAVIGSRTALSSQSTEPPPNHERAAHKATRRTRTALRGNYLTRRLRRTYYAELPQVRLTNAEWPRAARVDQRRTLDVRAADLQEEMTEQRFSVPSAPTKTAATQRTSPRAERAIKHSAKREQQTERGLRRYG